MNPRRRNAAKAKNRFFRRIAAERVRKLLSEAEAVFSEDKALANRYVALARRIAMKLNVRLPSELRRKYCRHCQAFLMPGRNCRVRLREGKVVYLCRECRHMTRLPYVREQKERRRQPATQIPAT